jgi:hypothetical protein
MLIKVFTDPNLGTYISRGWDPHKIVTGRVATLGSRTFVVECLPHHTIGQLKVLIETDPAAAPPLEAPGATTTHSPSTAAWVADNFVLRWGNTLLEDSATCATVGLKEGATIMLEVVAGSTADDDGWGAPVEDSDGVSRTQQRPPSKPTQGVAPRAEDSSTDVRKPLSSAREPAVVPVDRSKLLAAAERRMQQQAK